MSLTFKILGKPGNDNSVFVKIDTGQTNRRILLDTGANCLWQLERNEIAQIDHILFSHFHMDHICGFDTAFRLLYNRTEPVHIWGPKETIKVIQARAMGYTWNLVHETTNKIYIHEVSQNSIRNIYLKLEEGFSTIHEEETTPFENNFLYGDHEITIKATILDHKIDCLAYAITENPHINIDLKELKRLGLVAGPWCKELKSLNSGEITINQKTFALDFLRPILLKKTEGKTLGYITDALYNELAKQKLVPLLHGADEIVMECAYLDQEIALANKHHHMTVSQVASFAKDAAVKHLNLFHISDRYSPETRIEFLIKAREIFAATDYPDHWGIQI